MPDPNGAWIEHALAVSARLASIPKDEQPNIFAEESVALGVTAMTLRRNVLAARYCASHAKGVGMDLKDVIAAALTIEMLMRLERRDRAAAHKIRRAVFEGRITAREMQIRLKAVPERKPRGRQMTEWAGNALGMIEMFYTDPPKSFAKAENSDIGKLLKVDIEVRLPGETMPHAIFLSPLDSASECAGLTIEDQIPYILAACVIYPRVNCVLYEQSEANRLFEIMEKMRRRLPAKVHLASLFGSDDDKLEVLVDSME